MALQHVALVLTSAGAFILLLLASAYLGLSSIQISPLVDDKVLHVVTFFILTTTFYWILDTTRRRIFNFTLIVCTGILGVGSEFLQGFLPNGRIFDAYDILANLVGSATSLGICTWYHKRMLERRRAARQYAAVPGDDDEAGDVELGEGIGAHETGVVDLGSEARSLEDEVDNWDENAEDAWDEDDRTSGKDVVDTNGLPGGSGAVGTLEPDAKKRED